MKLLVIVLCLLSERFLVHVSSHKRFHWFSVYGKVVEGSLLKVSFLSSPWLMLIAVLLPLLLLTFIVLHFFANWLFGFVGLLLNVVIFYCCIGPGNPFYPMQEKTREHAGTDEVGTYLSQMNGQLFAILFWYIFWGPLAILAYRLISFCQNQKAMSQQAVWLTNWLDWLPARMTALLYLIVGNFQTGFRFFSKLFFSEPVNNQHLLSTCGLNALAGDEPVDIAPAEHLVEHAIIALLALFAFFTLVAWI